MPEISFTNLSNVPANYLTDLENINRRRRVQDALLARNLQMPQTQVTGGKYSRAVPYSPLQGATQLIEAALLKRSRDRSNQALAALGERYRAESAEEVRNILAQEQGAVPWRQADPRAAALRGSGSPFPEAQRVAEAMMRQNRTGTTSRPKPQQSTAGYFVQDPQDPTKGVYVTGPEGERFLPGFADPGMRYLYQQAGEAGTGAAKLGYEPELVKQKDLAANEAKKIINQTREEGTVDSSMRQNDVMKTQLQQIRDRTSGWSTGWGSLLKIVPSTDAKYVNTRIGTLKSAIAAENLQFMRDNSPTGGALGNVSDRDIRLLEDKLGALEQGVAEKDFNQLLDEFEATWDAIVHGKVDRYNTMYPDDPYTLPGSPGLPPGFVLD